MDNILAISVVVAIATAVPTTAVAQATPAWGAPGSQPATPSSAVSPSSLQQPARGWTVPAITNAATPALAGPARPTTAAATPAVAKGSLFDLPDNTPLTVGGRPSTAGALKRTIVGELAARAGPRHTVQVPARVLDAAHAAPVVVAGQAARSGAAGVRGSRTTPLTATAGFASLVPGVRDDRVTQQVKTSPMATAFCTSNGPPAIGTVDGVLTPGGQATVYGSCFGERAGHVQVIGQFGTVEMAFTDWAQTGITLQVPPGMRGTADATVAVTVVGADGRKSPAAQAMFRATREHVEVPARLWQPGAPFELTATTDATGSLFSQPQPNVAAAGKLLRNLRINPACALDAMSVDVIAGDVGAIHGFEQGPPNEANTTIDWTGTCVDTKTTTTHDYVIGSSQSVTITKACRVALEPRAWAWCPVGLAP